MPEAGAEESIGWWNCFRKVFGKLPRGLMFRANSDVKKGEPI